jgi:hypothetical protein
MATQPKPTTVQLGEHSVNLRYDFTAADALDSFGINIYDPSSYETFSPSKIVSLVWAGQLHQKTPLTRAQVAKELKIDANSYGTVAKAVANAIGAAIVDKA